MDRTPLPDDTDTFVGTIGQDGAGNGAGPHDVPGAPGPGLTPPGDGPAVAGECSDGDGDGYGTGPDCLGSDCDDADATTSPGERERCNGVDDDCDGAIDEAAEDCGSGCVSAGDGFARVTGGSCIAGRCEQSGVESCGDYSCEGGGDSGEVCATGCSVGGQDRDELCRPGLHCDDGDCLVGLDDGAGCDEDSDCRSGHCSNGLCCERDVCCVTVEDCGAVDGIAAVCDDVASCQGTRGQVACERNRCVTLGGEPDDSGCVAGMEADDCGDFVASTCSGGSDQSPPRCDTLCTRDSQCDPQAHCDSFRCVPDLPDGGACGGDADCISGHCQNGFCCSDGDCCAAAGDCPAFYGGPARCSDPTTCQGLRDEAVCEGSRCRTVEDVDNDRGCSLLVLADTCGTYPDLRCSGAVDQRAPVCAGSCLTSLGCDPDAHCSGGRCRPDLPPGSPCTAPDQCTTGYCFNGFCCAGGDCCAVASDCPGYSPEGERTCIDAESCSGEHVDVVCNGASRCEERRVAHSGACNGATRGCGLFQDAQCPDSCASSCTHDGDCDPGVRCTQGGQCSTDAGPGSPCGSSSQCAAGLTCVDQVCCSSSCDGSCERCNGAGQCEAIGAGEDPDDECDGLACTGYHFGWQDSSCHRRADLSDAAVACDGARQCQQAASLCPAQGIGPVVLECSAAACEQPAAGTCSGPVVGQCVPVPDCDADIEP